MTEYRLYPPGEIPHVSTAEFHADRERAPHLEQPVHRGRLEKARDFVLDAASRYHRYQWSFHIKVTDLGCGDGGLLQLLLDHTNILARGYDFQPSNAVGWVERGVRAEALDVFGVDRNRVRLGDIVVVTEVLEHLADPHEVLRWLMGEGVTYVVASSPYTETDLSHDACHAWAWDQEGYQDLLWQAGYHVIRHETVGMFQVVLAAMGGLHA